MGSFTWQGGVLGETRRGAAAAVGRAGSDRRSCRHSGWRGGSGHATGGGGRRHLGSGRRRRRRRLRGPGGGRNLDLQRPPTGGSPMVSRGN